MDALMCQACHPKEKLHLHYCHHQGEELQRIFSKSGYLAESLIGKKAESHPALVMFTQGRQKNIRTFPQVW